MEWEEIFASHMLDNGLLILLYIFKLYKELIQLKIKKKKNKKKTIFFQRRYTADPQISEKLLSITNHQENTNQNHSKVSLYTCQGVYYLKTQCS